MSKTDRSRNTGIKISFGDRKVIISAKVLRTKTFFSLGDPAQGQREKLPTEPLLYLKKKKITYISYFEKYNNYILIQSCSNSSANTGPPQYTSAPQNSCQKSQPLSDFFFFETRPLWRYLRLNEVIRVGDVIPQAYCPYKKRHQNTLSLPCKDRHERASWALGLESDCQELRVIHSPQLTKQRPQSYNSKELFLATNLNELGRGTHV